MCVCVCVCVCVCMCMYVYVCACDILLCYLLRAFDTAQELSSLRFLNPFWRIMRFFGDASSRQVKESCKVLNEFAKYVWCMMYDVWCMVYDIWCMIYDVWYMMYDDVSRDDVILVNFCLYLLSTNGPVRCIILIVENVICMYVYSVIWRIMIIITIYVLSLCVVYVCVWWYVCVCVCILTEKSLQSVARILPLAVRHAIYWVILLHWRRKRGNQFPTHIWETLLWILPSLYVCEYIYVYIHMCVLCVFRHFWLLFLFCSAFGRILSVMICVVIIRSIDIIILMYVNSV